MARELPELTEEQKKFIDANWDKMKLTDLVRKAFGNPTLDGRSVEAKAIQQYLGEKRPKTSLREKKEEIVLTEQAKEYIYNNAKHVTATIMARTIFNNPFLTTLNQETRAVLAYLRTLPPEVRGIDLSDQIEDEYKAVNTVKQVVEKINNCVFTNFDESTINTQQRKNFEQIKGFLRSPRFLQMMNSYSSKVSRKIFEEEFVRTVYDKPDLTPDELNLCINLCSNYVLMINVNQQLDMLSERFETIVTDPDAPLSQALAEMIKAKTGELNACDQRQQKLIADLQGKRSERHKNKPNQDLTVAKLIEWWKDEEQRKQAIKREEMRMEETEGEINEIIESDDVVARILGFTKGELLRG